MLKPGPHNNKNCIINAHNCSRKGGESEPCAKIQINLIWFMITQRLTYVNHNNAASHFLQLMNFTRIARLALYAVFREMHLKMVITASPPPVPVCVW